MIKLFDREKITAAVFLAVLAVFLFHVFLLPLCRLTRASSFQCCSYEKLLRTRGSKREKFDSLKRRNWEEKSKLDAMRNRFCTENDVNKFLKDINRVLDETGNKLVTVDPVERKTPLVGGIRKAGIRVVMKGAYSALIRFFDRLERSGKLMTISEVSIEPEDEAGSVLVSSFVVSLFAVEEN